MRSNVSMSEYRSEYREGTLRFAVSNLAKQYSQTSVTK